MRRQLTLIILLAVVIAAFLPGAALADVWTDIADSIWQSTYGVSAQDALLVAQGRSDGSFGPKESITRGQFAKMTTAGLGISPIVPAGPTFSDVDQSHVFYGEGEECSAAGLLSGYADGTFHPAALVTREQSCSVLARWLAEQEIATTGAISGDQGSYPSLKAWYATEGHSYLQPFADQGALSPAHEASSAYLVSHQVMIGASSHGSVYLRPTTSVNRAQAVALVLRVKQVAAGFVPPVTTPVEPGIPTAVVLTDGQTPIKGVWSGTADQLASYLLSVAPSPRFTIPALDLAGYYVRYCAEAGVRADLLWAQMILETGYGMYSGDVSPEQNNYAGIGATGGGAPGYAFPTAEAGVMAQIAHMVAYVYDVSPVAWANSSTDPRFDLVSPHGFASVLADLNGRWAVPGTDYGQHIEAIARLINSAQ